MANWKEPVSVNLIYEFTHQEVIARIFVANGRMKAFPSVDSLLDKKHTFNPSTTEIFSKSPHAVRRHFLALLQQQVDISQHEFVATSEARSELVFVGWREIQPRIWAILFELQN